MKIEKISINGFRCFGPESTDIFLDTGLSVFVGMNGGGKTAVFQALSRLFGVTPSQRAVRRRDFHIAADQQELQTGATLSIDAIFSFPELEGSDEDDEVGAVPEFFSQMAVSAPDGPVKARMRLQATWADDGTPDGSIDEEIRWIPTLNNGFDWDECKRVQSVERGSIQLIYVPASRDAATQVTSLLKGRLWKAATWSKKFRKRSAKGARNIQKRFEDEEPAKFIIQRLSERWNQVQEADTDSTPILKLIESRFEELVRKVEFAFYPDEAGQERELGDLSDGQRSLFHIALTAATLDVEKDVLTLPGDQNSFDHEKIRTAYLTVLAIEEPENSLSPFFLSRVIAMARDIASLPSAQVALSSHSPAILARIEPQEVRYFRLDRETRRSSVRQLSLPEDNQEASKYVRLAVRAYPELYFARFVILGEGESERLIIPRIAEAMDIPLDPSFVPIVPLGGRYVGHFWRLLNDLDIPFATLLDFDFGRAHGGAKIIAQVVENLLEIGNDLKENYYVKLNQISPDEVNCLEDEKLVDSYEENDWLQALKLEGVFFSDPLDIDFSMLNSFPDAYQKSHAGGRGPRRGQEALMKNKSATLKTGGNPDLYGEGYDDAFKWYPYLFLNRSKPETHLSALSRIEKQALLDDSPPELKAFIEHVRDALKFED